MNETPRVSEACMLVAEIAGQLPVKTRDELTRLLGHSVAMPSRQELREMRLGLLVELVGEGEIPYTYAYDEIRAERNAQGASWSHSTGLIKHFGNWPTACRGAVDLAFAVTQTRAHAASPHPWPRVTYTRDEIARALSRASRKVGQEIGQWEYVELRRVERRLAANQGMPDPRLPDIRTIANCFGNWNEAIDKVTKERQPTVLYTSISAT